MNRQLRQLVIGLVALPLSLVPFVAYAELTPEGGLLAAKAQAAVAPPQLPELSAGERDRLAAAAPRWSGRVAVLVYHGLGEGNGEQRFTLSPGRFAEQVASMKAAGLVPVTAAEVAAAVRGEAELPDNAVLLSFDDGRTDAFLWADPVLADAGWKATMFVITDQAAERGLYYAQWERIEQLAASGRWDMQAHTAASHVEHGVGDGATLPALTSLLPGEDLPAYRRRIAEDLSRSVDALERHTGVRPTAFAYPFGAYGADRTNDPRVREVLAEELGKRFDVAYQQDDQETVPLTGCSATPLESRRLEVGDWSGQELVERLAQVGAQPEGRAPAC